MQHNLEAPSTTRSGRLARSGGHSPQRQKAQRLGWMDYSWSVRSEADLVTQASVVDGSSTQAGSKRVGAERLDCVGEYGKARRAMDDPIRPDTVSCAA
jgi:hypothetical protein